MLVALACAASSVAVLSSSRSVGGGDVRIAAFGVSILIAALALTQLSLRPNELHDRQHISFGNAFLVYFAVAYGLASLGPALPAVERVLPDALLAVDLFAIPLALASWMLGYVVLSRRLELRSISSILIPASRGISAPSVVLGAYASTVVARLALFGQGGFGYGRTSGNSESVSLVAQYLGELGSFGTIALVAAILGAHHTGRRQYQLVAWIALPTELLFGAVSGRKSFFLYAVIAVGVGLVWTRKVGWKQITLALGVAVFVIFPVVDEYRLKLAEERGAEGVSAEATFQNLAAAIDDALAGWVSDPGSSVGYSFERGMERVSDSERTALSIYTHTNGRDFESVSKIGVSAAARVVPRVLWPDKPVVRYGLEVSRDYYQLQESLETATSLAGVGDAYRYGGLIAVFVLMTLFGMWVAVLDSVIDLRTHPYLIVVFVPLADVLKVGELARVIPTSIRLLVFAGLFLRVLFSARLAVTTNPDRDSVAGTTPKLKALPPDGTSMNLRLHASPHPGGGAVFVEPIRGSRS